MNVNTQAVLPDLPAEHLRRGSSCELCGSGLPLVPPGTPGRRPRFCTTAKHGNRATCHDIAEALKRLEAVLPPARGELRKLKQRRLKRRSKKFTPQEELQMEELLAAIGPEYPPGVRSGLRAKLLNLSNRLNSNGWTVKKK